MNRLFYGDNLDVMRQHIAAESVDLVYLDPPFNSNRNYNVLFGRHAAVSADDAAQIQAFGDTWVWTPTTEQQYANLMGGEVPTRVADALAAMRMLIGENEGMAYLVNMAPRLAELHRTLKPTGTLYLHCDPTMSHYLKILLDAIFDVRQFRAEIVWKRTTAHSDGRQGRRAPGRVHDIILMYTKSDSAIWNNIFTDYDQTYIESHYRHIEEGTGRRFRKDNLTAAKGGGDTSYEFNGARPYPGRFWAYSRENMERFEAEGRLIYTRTGMPELKRYLDEMPGVSIQDVWTDIDPINPKAAERLGYPTQKPVALLERILAASSNPDSVVFDPFCGCGTTVDAAIKLKRQWIGIDITYIAIDLIEKRLVHTYGEKIKQTYEVSGIPRDKAAALALFRHSPFDFERWAVSMINAQPNQKQVGDKGVDGVARFPIDARGNIGRILVSVKGGRNLTPAMVRELGGTVSTQKAEMGVLILNGSPTKGMIDEANHAGTYTHPHYAKAFPRIQVITVDELLSGKRPEMPPTMLPYIQAVRARTPVDQASLFET